MKPKTPRKNRQRYKKDRPHVVVIDSEGQWDTEYGKTDKFMPKRLTTVWVKKISLVRYYYNTGEVQTRTFYVQLPPFKEMPIYLQRNYMKKENYEIHNIPWDTPGINRRQAIRMVRIFCEKARGIFAKGIFYESRILNDFGLWGQYRFQLDLRRMAYKDFDVKNLNKWWVKKYPEMPHDPLQECIFFLKDMLTKRILWRSIGINKWPLRVENIDGVPECEEEYVRDQYMPRKNRVVEWRNGREVIRISHYN